MMACAGNLKKEKKMIKPVCFRCTEELHDYGAVLIGPPNHSNEVDAGMEVSCFKYHICKACSKIVIKEMYDAQLLHFKEKYKWPTGRVGL